MNSEQIVEQVKKNMNSIQELIHNNEILKEKLKNLEYKIEKMSDNIELIKQNNEENKFIDCN
tara:strand:+ start:4399 stop:4584 length:186 start_codon:yes stop_codon:yes gene_type:complete